MNVTLIHLFIVRHVPVLAIPVVSSTYKIKETDYNICCMRREKIRSGHTFKNSCFYDEWYSSTRSVVLGRGRGAEPAEALKGGGHGASRAVAAAGPGPAGRRDHGEVSVEECAAHRAWNCRCQVIGGDA